MTKETLIMLCASLCLSFSLPHEASAQRGGTLGSKKEIRKAVPASPLADTVTSVIGERALLADRLEIKKRISLEKSKRNEELKEQLEHESLEMPAADLYGEDFSSNRVNPFAGTETTIPNQYNIDLNEFYMPIERKQVTSHYGYRRKFGRMHYGTDLALSIGDTVRACFSGKVRISSYERRGYGNYVVIRHPNGLETVYGHLSRSIVREGMVVKAGQPIALGGNTGRSTGPHLHFEARFMGQPINPEELFDFVEGQPRLDVYTFRKGAKASKTAERYAAKTKQDKRSERANSIRTHRIKRGDTLAALAKRYNTTVSKICQTNGITTKTILKVNSSLRIPG